MTLEGANNFSENDISTIYTMNSVQTGQYCVVVPKSIGDKVRMLVDLNMKKSFDSLVSNTITKDTLINDINDEYSNIEKDYKGSVLVIPMLDIDEFNNSINSNDKQTIFNETKKIGSITSEIYRKLCESGVDKAKIDQRIVIVEKTQTDKKFVNWLEEQMPNFVDGVDYNELMNKSVNNDINPFTGEASEPAVSNDVFGPQVDVSNEVKTEDNNISTNEVKTEDNNISTNDNIGGDDLFVKSDTLSQAEVAVTPEVDPKSETTESVEPEISGIEKRSKGFANLLILMVIIIGVTVASIELGKLLYNTFGL